MLASGNRSGRPPSPALNRFELSFIGTAARQNVGYACPQGHEFEIPMSVEADVPAVWECPRCGAEALSRDGITKEEKAEKPVRTHWDMLLERRSIKELEEILTERLELLRGGEIGPAHLHRPSKKKARSA